MIKLQTHRSDGDHYYSADGTPCYGVGIRTARSEGLLPSPSTILGVMSKPGITVWLQRQVAEAALDAAEQVKRQVEDRAEQVGTIVDLARKRSEGAMTLGTNIHAIAERCLKPSSTGSEPDDEDLSALDVYKQPITDYVAANVLRTRWCEQTVSHIGAKIAFAGRVDALVEHQHYGLSVIDWKSSKVPRRNGKPTPKWYDPYIIQLASYSYAIDGQPQPISVAIDTSPGFEGGIHEKAWSEIEVERGWRMFNLLYRLWCEVKKYSPHEYYKA